MLSGQASVKGISGPVTIASYAGESAGLGLDAYLGFLALVSISIGVLNLLPIPVLDGGHLMYYMVEIFTKKPTSDFVLDVGQLATDLRMTNTALAIKIKETGARINIKKLEGKSVRMASLVLPLQFPQRSKGAQ